MDDMSMNIFISKRLKSWLDIGLYIPGLESMGKGKIDPEPTRIISDDTYDPAACPPDVDFPQYPF